MTDYIHLDTDALDALPPEEAYQAATQIHQTAKHLGAAYADRIAADLAAEHGQTAAAEILSIRQPTLAARVTRHKERTMYDDTKTTRTAYDFGDSLHIMDIDAFGAYVEGTVEVLPLDGDRDETLETAGYTTHGQWVLQGEADGITVTRT